MLLMTLQKAISALIVTTTALILTFPCHADESTKAVEKLVRFIDEQMEETWRSRQLVPSNRSSGAAFLRRASLDITGSIPSADKVRTFLADKSVNKREQVVEQWLKGIRLRFGRLVVLLGHLLEQLEHVLYADSAVAVEVVG